MLFLKDDDYKNRLLSSYNIYKYINIFNVVSESKNLTIASAKLNISESAISKNILLLENLLGFKLFNRNGCKGLKINTLGEQFKTYCQQIKNDINNICDFAENSAQDKTIKVCAHQLAFKKYLLPIVNQLKNKCCFDFSTDSIKNACDDFYKNKYDIIIYPLDAYGIKQISNYATVKILKEYQLCFFFNKKNKFFVKNKDLNLKNIQELNIAPLNNQNSFKFYYDLLRSKVQIKNSMNILDTNILYYGIRKNWWVGAIGEEFNKQYNCKSFKVYKITKDQNFYTKLNWCLCFSSSNKKLGIINEIYKKLSIIA